MINKKPKKILNTDDITKFGEFEFETFEISPETYIKSAKIYEDK